MRLQADHTIQNLSADGFEHLGPIDVGFFIKAGFQLDHHGHLFATAHRLAQQVHQFSVVAGTVDGLLDGQHLRVVHGLAQERQHTAKALKRLVNQHIALLESLEE